MIKERPLPSDQEQGFKQLLNNEMQLNVDIAFCHDLKQFLSNAVCSDFGCMYSSDCEILRR
ncbi:MAG: hypothetical protein Q7J35_03520 [Candidatus Methanoperedens sp.]|nr:hypothetical protein [Candidatus Methanoperedens sp.]